MSSARLTSALHGQAPARRTQPERPLTRPSAQRIVDLQRAAGNRAVMAHLRQRDERSRRVQRVAADSGLAPAGPQPILRRGSVGPAVATLQETLNTLALGPALEPDGVFGNLTVGAVTVFQAAHGLVADGIVGPLTHEALTTSSLVGSAGPAPSGTPTPAATTPGAAGGTAGQAPPGTASGTGALLGAPFGCHYPDPAEKEQSKTSPGFMLEESPNTFVLGDFANNSSTLKEAHRRDLAQLVSRFDLRSPASNHKVTIIEGLTDCAGGFEQNTGLRRQRALETKLDLIKKDGGALSSNVPAEPVAAFFATEPAGNETPQGRARNRGVRLVIESKSAEVPETPGPTGTDPGPPLCLNDRPMAKKWGLQSRAGVSGGAGALGGVANLFTLFDLENDRSYPATFTGGDLGPGTPVQVTIDNPLESPETFETEGPVCPEEFNGIATISGAEGPFIPLIPIGVEVAAIDLAPATKPESISIGGLEIIFGASAGVAKGGFTVFS